MSAPQPSVSARFYRGKDADGRRAERRERLLAAGLELFGTDGYASASIPRLCTAAGVSTAHFYESFATREAVLIGVYDAVVREVQAEAAAAMAAAAPEVYAQVRAGLEAFVAPLLRDERKARVNFVEVVAVQGFTEGHRREVFESFAGVMQTATQRLVDAGRLRPHQGRVVTLALLGATTEPLLDWFVCPPQERQPIGDVLDELTRIYVAVLTAT